MILFIMQKLDANLAAIITSISAVASSLLDGALVYGAKFITLIVGIMAIINYYYSIKASKLKAQELELQAKAKPLD